MKHARKGRSTGAPRRAWVGWCALILACEAAAHGHGGIEATELAAAPVVGSGNGRQGTGGAEDGGERGAARGGEERSDRRAACLRRNAGAPARYARIVAAFCAEYHNLAGVGASLAIVEGDGPPFVATAGVACLGGQEVTAATRFRVGSITKLLTAALVLRQADAGRLDLDDEVVRVLPELAAGVDERAGTITWRQLLTHTAGLPDPSPLELGSEWLTALGERPLWREPGALWSYSSDGYAVVGAALEQLRGEGYTRLLADELLAPLGLDAAIVEPEMALRTGAACGHLGRGEQARAFSVVDDLALGTGDARWTAPAGGAIVSAAELVTLARDLVDPGRSPLSPAARRELLAADVPTLERPGERYGLGVRARVGAGGSPIYGHSGATGDFAADLVFAPDRRFAAAALSNDGDPLRMTLATVLQELLEVAPERAAAMGPAHLYTGTYRADRFDEEVTISAHGSGLRLSAPGLLLTDVPLGHAGDGRFVAGRPELGGFTFLFVGADARASDLRGHVFVGARVE
ncbi:serine hydrolase domain-containing protein [Nannocystis punicea]|uniref:Serine hydrolase n=1 Tax=Nannocystis punicea TaxID=2995304 RepID=A0ABY7H001_9BACT|nr:serine hydrolase domain-containing protein [Nannocystis poenicansa]WAS92576.1 serine hydrolase [Nannocystis poenicansa]